MFTTSFYRKVSKNKKSQQKKKILQSQEIELSKCANGIFIQKYRSHKF